MANDGSTLERTVAAIERILAGKDVQVEKRSRRLRDKDTGKRREHDVLVTRNHGHYETIVAVECRDRSRKVTVPEVEAFKAKCAATGVNLGVLVSSKGFYASARRKAALSGIVCTQIDRLDTVDWLDDNLSIVVFERHFGHFDATVMFGDRRPATLAQIHDTNGKIVDEKMLSQMVAGNVPKHEDPGSVVGRSIPVNMRLQTINWTALDDDGEVFEIDHISVTTSYVYEKKQPTVDLHKYGNEKKSYEFARHDLKIGDHDGHIVMVQNEDRTVTVYWTKDG